MGVVFDAEAVVTVRAAPEAEVIKEQVHLLVVGLPSHPPQHLLQHLGLNQPLTQPLVAQTHVRKEVADVESLLG